MFEGGLAELHTHLGGSVAADIMWSLAHEQGIALPTRDYWEFDRMVTVSDPRGVADLDALDRIYHLTELIQSSTIAVEKAARYGSRGVVGVDIAGPRPVAGRFDYTQIREHVELARELGLGVTIHVGEEGGPFGTEEVGEVAESLRPDRIGHGILAAHDPELMALLRGADITLEICPTSNLLTKALPDEAAVRDTLRTFVEHGVPFTIATDGPEMMRTHLRDEFELLRRIGALDEDEARAANERGHEASFLGRRVAAGAA